MHVRYNPEDYKLWLQYYSNQATQTGYGIEGYRGVPYQRGAGLGSFFRSIFRWAVPVIKSAGEHLGKHALTAGANIATDLARGKPLFESAKEHTKEEASKLLKTASEALQGGEGLGVRPKGINMNVNDTFTKFKKKRRKK